MWDGSSHDSRSMSCISCHSVHAFKSDRAQLKTATQQATCRTCHQYMDPIGLALDNFDVTGRWRHRENGAPLDTRGTMYDGMAVSTPADLTRSLVARPIPLRRAFAENLMAYATGRRVEDYDQPTIRAIVPSAELSATALGRSSSPTIRKTSVCRAGLPSTRTSPWNAAST